jgi:DNA-binding response OmpR family regulator
VRSEAPDLVLLDVMMPRKNGYEVCQEIRAEPALQGTRILMLTAKGRETEVTKGLAMGADAYMTKPFSTKELVTKVKPCWTFRRELKSRQALAIATACILVIGVMAAAGIAVWRDLAGGAGVLEPILNPRVC